jgi:hypothetical protein
MCICSSISFSKDATSSSKMKSLVSGLPNCDSCCRRVVSLSMVVGGKWVLKMGVSLSFRMPMIRCKLASCTTLAYSFTLSAANISSNLLEMEAVFISSPSTRPTSPSSATTFSSFSSFFTPFFSFLSCFACGSSLSSVFFLGLRFFLAGYYTGFTYSASFFSISIQRGFSTLSLILMGSGEATLGLEAGLGNC